MANKSKRRTEQQSKKRAAKEAAMSRPGGASKYARRRNGEPPSDQGTPPKPVCGECFLRPCRCYGTRFSVPVEAPPSPSLREMLLDTVAR